MRYLLDTNVLSEAVKTDPDKSGMKNLRGIKTKWLLLRLSGMSFNLVVSVFHVPIKKR